MAYSHLVQFTGFSDWFLGITHERSTGFQCWLINPKGMVLSDHQFHSTEKEAKEAGRAFIQAAQRQGYSKA
ncbi:MAG: hypothetical protein HC922_02950 [Leptolyngbyaceae cyanobacterium SM2_3_12]|nr:hypothetical protein [Leptolyngbyaceae cyanobacterium SM2_3_12]